MKKMLAGVIAGATIGATALMGAPAIAAPPANTWFDMRSTQPGSTTAKFIVRDCNTIRVEVTSNTRDKMTLTVENDAQRRQNNIFNVPTDTVWTTDLATVQPGWNFFRLHSVGQGGALVADGVAWNPCGA